MSELTQVQIDAIKILDGIEEIARNEMLIRGAYITPVVRHDLARQGTICGGRQACMIGSMWIAAGFTVKGECYGIELPGVTTSRLPVGYVHPNLPPNYKGFCLPLSRRDAAALHPPLHLAYTTMNEVCGAFAVEHWPDDKWGRYNQMEELFEAQNPYTLAPLMSDADLFMLLERGREAIRGLTA